MRPILEFFVGRSWPFKLVVTKDYNGDPIESESYDLWFTVNTEYTAEDADALVRMSTVTAHARDGGISRIYDPEEKTLTFSWVVPVPTTQAIGPGKYPFDIQIQAPLSRLTTLQDGTINALPRVTKSYNA